MPKFWLLSIISVLCMVFKVAPLAASESATTVSATCERVAEEASRRTGVPISVLKAISLTETGKKIDGKLRPWPWTVNMEGAGHWFDTLDEARAYVFKEFKRGARSFDVGCFQINYKWHNQHFSSIDEMFDPLANALYAAKFLAELYDEKGSWNGAAGAYHSRTKEYAERYSARFAELRQRFLASDGAEGMVAMNDAAWTGAPQTATQPMQTDIPEIPDIVAAMNAPTAPRRPPRVNTYPLLQRSGTAAPPLGAAPGASLFALSLNKGEGN
ncbi:transglycosylase-like protein with SLT domain [Rhodobacter aestuarii]|uniref:Transglycosylase SLT domain-containing protein n=2 Tax=Rhodobacter aestuarii TaxID=453582 RepID=A0A1N7LFZ3_9RHOB|nr:transglycosylase-like protein with SLT domain [Rhodobacter aestuarii]SIS72758.1 Transglycosylase SLT domain-containing protein [Rhodobacter aestuarii]